MSKIRHKAKNLKSIYPISPGLCSYSVSTAVTRAIEPKKHGLFCPVDTRLKGSFKMYVRQERWRGLLKRTIFFLGGGGGGV